MKYQEIRELLDKGFTAEYIMNMESSENSDDHAEDPQQDPEEKPDPEEEPGSVNDFSDALKAFGGKLDDLIKEMQASNILRSEQSGAGEPMSAEDALAAVLMPHKKEEK